MEIASRAEKKTIVNPKEMHVDLTTVSVDQEAPSKREKCFTSRGLISSCFVTNIIPVEILMAD